LPTLSVSQILAWADAHRQRTDHWPTPDSGRVPGAPFGLTWQAIHQALRQGNRGLPGGSSLACLLAEQRGVRHRLALPPLAIGQILAWCDAHRQRTGRWPTQYSGAVADAPGETWKGINHALRLGYRNLSGGSSLARLLEQERGVRHLKRLPP